MAFVFQARRIDINTGGETPIVLLRGRDATNYGINPGDRLLLKVGRRTMVAVADITHHSIDHGDIGIFEESWKLLKVKYGTPVAVEALSRPPSVRAITKKLLGHSLNEAEVRSIISDIVKRRLGTIETTYFVASNYLKPYSEAELIWTVKAMAETGDTFTWSKRQVVDKHSVGGLAGNRTTMVAIPIIASLGLIIPKTSSRAITSPSGTADTMEVLAPVTLASDKVRQVVNRCGGCLIWGGGLNIAPADDIIIRVSRPLSLEPYDKMIVSILAKKVAMGVKYLVIDMPYGIGTKIPNKRTAKSLALKFSRLGAAFGMKVRVCFDPARQPIGQGIGPSLEARDVVRVLTQSSDRPLDLETKALSLAGQLLEMSGKCQTGTGLEMASKELTSGRAWKKMQQIIKSQGGNPHITSEEIMKDAQSYTVTAKRSGRITAIDNRAIDDIARTLGAPDHKIAGLYLHHKLGHRVKKGQPLFSLYSHSLERIKLAKSTLPRVRLMTIST